MALFRAWMYAVPLALLLRFTCAGEDRPEDRPEPREPEDRPAEATGPAAGPAEATVLEANIGEALTVVDPEANPGEAALTVVDSTDHAQLATEEEVGEIIVQIHSLHLEDMVNERLKRETMVHVSWRNVVYVVTQGQIHSFYAQKKEAGKEKNKEQAGGGASSDSEASSSSSSKKAERLQEMADRNREEELREVEDERARRATSAEREAEEWAEEQARDARRAAARRRILDEEAKRRETAAAATAAKEAADELAFRARVQTAVQEHLSQSLQEERQLPVLTQLVLQQQQMLRQQQQLQQQQQQQLKELQGFCNQLLQLGARQEDARNRHFHLIMNRFLETVTVQLGQSMKPATTPGGTKTPTRTTPTTPRLPRCQICDACKHVAKNPRSRLHCERWRGSTLAEVRQKGGEKVEEPEAAEASDLEEKDEDEASQPALISAAPFVFIFNRVP